MVSNYKRVQFCFLATYWVICRILAPCLCIINSFDSWHPRRWEKHLKSKQNQNDKAENYATKTSYLCFTFIPSAWNQVFFLCDTQRDECSGEWSPSLASFSRSPLVLEGSIVKLTIIKHLSPAVYGMFLCHALTILKCMKAQCM